MVEGLQQKVGYGNIVLIFNFYELKFLFFIIIMNLLKLNTRAPCARVSCSRLTAKMSQPSTAQKPHSAVVVLEMLDKNIREELLQV